MLKLSKTIIILQLKVAVTSNYTSKIHDHFNKNSVKNFALIAFPVLRLLARKEFGKYRNS